MRENDMSLSARREGGRIGGGRNKNYHLICHFVTFLFFPSNWKTKKKGQTITQNVFVQTYFFFIMKRREITIIVRDAAECTHGNSLD